MGEDRRWYARGWSFRPTHHAPHGWGRLGAFVDGVYAIAATLLVIELQPPEDAAPGELGSELAHLGPLYFGVRDRLPADDRRLAADPPAGRVDARRSTTTRRCSCCSRSGLYALTPFTTAVLAQAFGNADDLGTAVRLTAGLLFVALLVFAGLLLYSRSAGLLRDDIDPDARTLYLRNSMLAPLVPAAAFAVSYAGALGRAGAADRAQPARAAAAGVASTARRRRPRTDVHQPIAPVGTTLISTSR